MGTDPVYLSDGGQLIYAQYKNSNMAWFFDDLYLPDGAQESRDGFVSETVVTTLENVEITQQNGVTTLICAETSSQTQHVELPLLYYPGYTVTAGQGGPSSKRQMVWWVWRSLRDLPAAFR